MSSIAIIFLFVVSRFQQASDLQAVTEQVVAAPFDVY